MNICFLPLKEFAQGKDEAPGSGEQMKAGNRNPSSLPLICEGIIRGRILLGFWTPIQDAFPTSACCRMSPKEVVPIPGACSLGS